MNRCHPFQPNMCSGRDLNHVRLTSWAGTPSTVYLARRLFPRGQQFTEIYGNYIIRLGNYILYLL